MNGAWVIGVLSGMSGRDAADPSRATIILPRRLVGAQLGETESMSRLGNLCAGTRGNLCGGSDCVCRFCSGRTARRTGREKIETY